MLSGMKHGFHVAHGAHRCRAGSFVAANDLLRLLIPDFPNFPDAEILRTSPQAPIPQRVIPSYT